MLKKSSVLNIFYIEIMIYIWKFTSVNILDQIPYKKV